MEDKVENNSEKKQKEKKKKEKRKEKGLKKNEERFMELQDNKKCNSICIIGLPGEEEEEQGTENLFERVMTENFPNLMKEKSTSTGSTQGLNQDEPKRPTPRYHN